MWEIHTQFELLLRTVHVTRTGPVYSPFDLCEQTVIGGLLRVGEEWTPETKPTSWF